MELRSTATHLEIVLSEADRRSPVRRHALRSLEERSDLTEFEAEERGTDVVVRFPLEAWRRFGTPPERDAPPEEVDLWVSLQEQLARLLGRKHHHVALATIGFVGGPDCHFVLTVDGVQVEGGSGANTLDFQVPCLPPVFEAIARVAAHPAPWAREDQLGFLGRLREHLDGAAALLEDSAAGFSVTYSDHLRDYRFERIERAAVAWRPARPGARLLSLHVDVARADGAKVPLDLGKVHPAAPIASLSAKEHLLLSDEVAHVARVAKQHRNALPRSVEGLLSDPTKVFPEGPSSDGIDFSEYSPRVLGFAPILRPDRLADIRASGTAWYHRDDDPDAPYLRLEIAEADGARTQLVFATRERVLEDIKKLEDAAQKNEVVELQGRRVVPTAPLLQELKRHVQLDRPGAAPAGASTERAGVDGRTAPSNPRGKGEAAVIKETEGTVDEPVPASVSLDSVPWELVDARLRPGFRLKDYQRQGIGWMWQHYQAHRPGVLLADDMGLGKTLQVASFLLLQQGAGFVEDRARPTMIVSPLILLANWARELEKCFQPGTFDILTLASERMRQLAGTGLVGPAMQQQRKVALVAYDTLARYQKELLKIDWASAVLDEAQHVKNPDTYRTAAVRGLKRTFGICATGTPVENRLLDLWTLFEFLSPGMPFGARQEFSETFEDDPAGVRKLRAALGYPGRKSAVLRRQKDDVLKELPPLYVEEHPVAMTPNQVELERTIVRRRRGGLDVLGDLQKLYQHPQLLAARGEDVALSPERALQESPKLACCVRLLKGIQARGEKAIVFTLWTAMQELLQGVLIRELGIPRVRIVNGESNQGAKSQKYIDEFERSDGFDVIILSPLAAGTGLTITAANHVIHYGRWWNPAKEDQATARAYRLGQTREVHVHYPLLHHPNAPAMGFDVKLHELVMRKRAMARDFLAPTDNADVMPGEVAEVLSEKETEGS